jgi:hypothetical protein
VLFVQVEESSELKLMTLNLHAGLTIFYSFMKATTYLASIIMPIFVFKFGSYKKVFALLC